MSNPRSGDQYLISHGAWQAEITQVGATLRALSCDSDPLLDGFSPAERAIDGRGQVLIPWPNRITGGAYTFGRREVEAPLTEPARATAIHGLVRWLTWSRVEQLGHSVSLACTLYPQPGYEWQLDVGVTYELSDAGLTVSMEATNRDVEELPLGVGCHPYLTIGQQLVNELTLRLPAEQRLELSPDGSQQMLSVADTEYDFIGGRRIGTTVLDTAYTDLVRDDDGRSRASLVSPTTGRGVELWVDEAFGWLMVYSADSVSRAERRRRAVAVEPMTCPPEAFRTCTDVVMLTPGATWRGQWGLGLVT